MPPDDGVPRADSFAHGAHVMTVCNACRYCEQYCPVFPAMEQRRTFGRIDLVYLAQLCHNCGECLYACQYAPPHEFGIDVPRTLAAIRLESYEDYCWPRGLAFAFRRNGVATSLALAAALVMLMFAATAAVNPDAFDGGSAPADFYAVVPHGVMVSVFGGVFLFVLVAMAIGVTRFRRDLRDSASLRDDTARHERRTAPRGATLRALRDVLTLRHLHATGTDCPSVEESRSPWRRWWHHCTFYGFALCFASTSVAAVYHALGWSAPYDYDSLPVILGTAGGLGLLAGPAGLLVLRTRRDPDLADGRQRGLDESFITLLLLTSVTGLVLLAARNEAAMGVLLIVHLGVVLALFLTLPYGKFVHGLYRAVALHAFARESPNEP